MKKKLLLLSCFLATWCSIQASMIQSVSASSMVLASAPWAAPAPSYPAVIKSVAYDKNDGRKVVVTFKANQSGEVSFDLDGSGQVAQNLGKTYVNKGDNTVSFELPKYWDANKACALIIKVNGGACGGTRLEPSPNPNPVDPGNIAGHINDVKMIGCESTENGLPLYISFEYNMIHANNPYLFIKEGDGNIVAKLKISNTTEFYYTKKYSDYSSALKPGRAYMACLYDVDAQGKEKDLKICYPFNMPEEKHYTYAFDCRWEPTMNQYHIVLNPNIHPLVDKVQIWVEPINGGTYQYTYSGPIKKEYYFGIPSEYKGKYYVVRIRWSNGVVRTCTVLR